MPMLTFADRARLNVAREVRASRSRSWGKNSEALHRRRDSVRSTITRTECIERFPAASLPEIRYVYVPSPTRVPAAVVPFHVTPPAATLANGQDRISVDPW